MLGCGQQNAHRPRADWTHTNDQGDRSNRVLDRAGQQTLGPGQGRFFPLLTGCKQSRPANWPAAGGHREQLAQGLLSGGIIS